jgi:hypothetical protein
MSAIILGIANVPMNTLFEVLESLYRNARSVRCSFAVKCYEQLLVGLWELRATFNEVFKGKGMPDPLSGVNFGIGKLP